MNEIRQESLWTSVFADDFVSCSESRKQVVEGGEVQVRCRNERLNTCVLKRRRTTEGDICTDVLKVDEFKIIPSTMQSNSLQENKRRKEHGQWSGWRRVSGVICYKKVPTQMKWIVCRTVEGYVKEVRDR